MSDMDREIVLRFLAQPTDVNFGGNVHGGSVMKWLDQAGYVCATTWSKKYCVTVFVGDMNFHHPVKVGDLVEVTAKVIHTGKTSMHVGIELHACNPRSCTPSKAIRCMMVFVAVDDERKPTAVPQWQPKTEKDIALENYALKIKEVRRRNQEALDAVNEMS